MKIAMLHTYLVNPTGGERQILRLAMELQKKGHDVEIFTNKVDYKKCFPELLNNLNITVVPSYHIYTPFGRNNQYNSLLDMIKLGKEVSKKKFDIINNHNFPTEWAVYFAKRKMDIPAVWMCNEPPFWFFLPEAKNRIRKIYWPLYEVLDKISIKSLDKIMVLSNLMGEIVKKTYGRNSEIVRSGVCVEEFENISGEKFREMYDLENSFMLLQVGTLGHYKKQEDSIKALNLLSKKYENLKLVFIGIEGDKYKDNLIELIKRYKLDNNVLFLGAVSDDTLKQAYAASDVFLFPAFQSWSLVTVEAMASGKPVIVSDMCGVSEIIRNMTNGFVIEHRNYKKMAEYIEQLINSKSLREEIGRNAYKFVKENISWEKYAKNMERIFEEMLR